MGVPKVPLSTSQNRAIPRERSIGMTDMNEKDDDGRTRAELIEELRSLRQGVARAGDIPEKSSRLQSYESMVKASRDLMVFVDSTYIYRAANQAYCDEHRLTRKEIVGHKVAEVFGDAAFEKTLKPKLDRCLAGGSVAFDFWWNSPSRGRRHVDVQYDPHFENDGSVSGVLVNVRDTTEQTLTKEQLERSVEALEISNRDLEDFSDSLAHDLKTPLLTVTNFSHYLDESLGGKLDEQQADYLQRIRYAGQQMMHIIDDLRDLADVSRADIREDDVDFTVLGRTIIDDLSALTPDRNVVFEAEPGMRAVGDGTLLRLLLTNLLQNAWKYTGREKETRIELGVVKDADGIATYHVRDNGIGFDNSQRDRIFRAFERLDTGGDFTGSGLGLATVKRIVHRHGGRVWAEGVPREGAVFRFTLASSSTEMSGVIIDRRNNIR